MTVLTEDLAADLVYEQGRDIVIPEIYTSIESYAFKSFDLTSVIIPNSITSIAEYAFAYNDLTNLTIPDSVNSIGMYAFFGNQLSSVEIPDSVTSLAVRAFDGNPLDSVSISADATFDRSLFPEGIEIIRREPAPIPAPTPTPAPVPTPTPEPTPDQGDSIDKIDSIDDITTPDSISTFELKEPIQINGQNIETVIVGTNKKDKITGTSEGEILSGQVGKDVLKGGGGADGFLFNTPNGFGKKQTDQIRDFDSDEGDSILVDKDVFGLGKKIKLKVVTGKKASKKAAKSKNDFIYDDKKGLLYFNENGKEEGWGDGGLFVKLKGAPELDVSDFTIV